jgi:5-carboxymethyl-2-hydroxymuconate isomerase
MPHLVIDLSPNLAADGQRLADALHAVLLNCPMFEPGAIRVRTHVPQATAIADLHSENAYADLRLRIGPGRSVEERQALGQSLMAAAEGVFAGHLKGGHFALSLTIEETDARFSWKRNTIHDRLRSHRGRE